MKREGRGGAARRRLCARGLKARERNLHRTSRWSDGKRRRAIREGGGGRPLGGARAIGGAPFNGWKAATPSLLAEAAWT